MLFSSNIFLLFNFSSLGKLISDGKEVYIAGILELLEPAGIHSGDSTAVLPPFSLADNIVENIKTKSIQLALSLDVKGLLNIQFALKNDDPCYKFTYLARLFFFLSQH